MLIYTKISTLTCTFCEECLTADSKLHTECCLMPLCALCYNDYLSFSSESCAHCKVNIGEDSDIHKSTRKFTVEELKAEYARLEYIRGEWATFYSQFSVEDFGGPQGLRNISRSYHNP